MEELALHAGVIAALDADRPALAPDTDVGELLVAARVLVELVEEATQVAGVRGVRSALDVAARQLDRAVLLLTRAR